MEHFVLMIVARGYLSPETSSFLIDVVATAGLLVVAAVGLWLALRERRAAARASATFDPGAALLPGEAVVMGTVEREEGASVAVRVELEQEGTESESSGVWTHRWTETNRKVHIHPFYIRHASGSRIRVEPDEDVMLVDAMDGMIWVDLTKRVRVAELLPGEKVYVSGELRRAPDPEGASRGYRARSEGYLLVPPRGRRMLISSEPLGERFERRARFHLRWAAYAVAALMAFNALFAPFHARRWAGTTVDVEVTRLHQYKDSDDDDRFDVTVRSEDGYVFSNGVSRVDFARLREGNVIKARYVPAWRFASVIGPVATATEFAYGAVVLLAGFIFVYVRRTRLTRPWYDDKLIEQGKGRLADSREAAS